VFLWVPLLAFGILTIRLFNALVWSTSKVQVFLKDGAKQPLKSVGYIAAAIVFVVAFVWRTRL